MTARQCRSCGITHSTEAFRAKQNHCKWCQFSSMETRAVERYKDKRRAAARRHDGSDWLSISQADFVSWYLRQPDRCHYCHTTYDELRKLRLKRSSWGYYVSWDIDRLDSARPYEAGNMVLSCFMCNMAKGNYFTAAEAAIIGKAVRQIILARLKD